MSDFDRLFAPLKETPNMFEDMAARRKRDAALRATTAMSQRPTFQPEQAARRNSIADNYQQETGVAFDPRYVSPENEGGLQAEIDRQQLTRIANESERAANWFAEPGNAELSFDDLNTVGFWGGVGNRAAFGADATYDSIRLNNQLDTLAELERNILNKDRSFSEIYDENWAAEKEAAAEEGRVKRDQFDKSLGVYVNARLSSLFRLGDDAEMLDTIATQREEVLEEIATEDVERAAAFRGSQSFEQVNRRMATAPEAKTFMEGLSTVWGIAKQDPLAFTSWALQVSAESTPGIAAAAAVTAVTKNPLAATTVMGVSSTQRAKAGAFNELVQAGGYDLTKVEGRKALLADPRVLNIYRDQAATYGLVVGLMDAASAGLASQQLAKNPAGDFLIQMLVQGVMGGGGEALGRIAADMPLDWTEVVVEGIVEIVTGPLEVLSTGGKATANKIAKMQETTHRKKFFDAISQKSVGSKLRARVPKKYQKLVADVTRDGPVEDIYINPEDMNELFQEGGATVEEFFAALPDLDVETFQRALDTGTDFKIPTAVYAAHIVGSSYEAKLQPHIRFGALEMSMAEAQNLRGEIEKSMTDMAENVATIQKEVEALGTEMQEQYATLVSALQMAGRTPAVAAREALPMAKFLETRARRAGVPVSELVGKYALPTVAQRDNADTVRRGGARPILLTETMTALAGGEGAQTQNTMAIQNILDEEGQEANPDTVRSAVLKAYSRGTLIGEPEDAILMRPEDVTRSEGDELMQTVTLRDGTEDLSEWGLDVPQKTRELAVRLQKRQRAKYGKINAKQRGPKTVQKMAKWMADELVFEMQTPDRSAQGWYGEKFQNALNTMATVFPELVDQQALTQRDRPTPGVETVADVRALMTMILAITSNGQKVVDNYRLATMIYKTLRADGDFENAMPKALRSGDMALKLNRMRELAEERGGYENARLYLLEEITVSEMNRQRKASGLNVTSGMPADMIVPRSAVEFGPKLGAFYANLSGANGFLTMDMWWVRTINRYRGDMLPKVSGMKGNEVSSTGKPQGLHRFKLLISRPDLTDNQALNYVTEYAQRYKDKGYKNGSLAEKAANTLYKAAFVELNEQPAGAADRAFMYEVAIAAQQEVERRTGETLSIADVQAIIWYYEKRLYADMGVRDSGDISYEEAARRAVEAETQPPIELAQSAVGETRADVMTGDLRGDGRKFSGFFADVTDGTRQRPQRLDEYMPVIELPEDVKTFAESRAPYSGNFEDHIQTSIPGYREMQDGVGFAISKIIDQGSLLDVGASEGAMAKAVVNANPGARAVALDPNLSMQNTFATKPQVDGVEFSLSAFGSAADEGKVAWTEDDGTDIPYFATGGERFDVVHEAMVFQFVSNSRGAQVARVKELMKPDGLFLTFEKFGGPAQQYAENEAKKDRYKALYYDQETLAAKAAEVLQTGGDAVEGMTDLQVSVAEMEAVLSRNFAHVHQVWDSGNFKGFAASDNADTVAGFLAALPSLDSPFANVEAPRQVSGGQELFQLATNMFGEPQVTSLDNFRDFPLEAFKADNWFIVSPNTDLLPENAPAMREKLDALGLEYVELQGVYMGEPDGISFMVVGPRWQGLALGREFTQESILTGRGLEYTDGSGKKAVPFDDVLTGETATAQENHSIRLSDGRAFSLNLLWPGVVEPGLVGGKYYGIPLEEDGTLRMSHWSGERLDVLKPELAGTGPLAGEERRRRQVKGVFFGLNIGGTNGYTKESLGPHRHDVFVDPEELYPFYEDPDGLRAKIEDRLPSPQRVGRYEELIRDAGYKGYVVTDGPVGMVAKSFVDQPVPEQGQVLYQSDAFKTWFGDSKVVDENGEPLMLYHGTPGDAPVAVFDPARIGSRDGGFFGEGFYFTNDLEEAETYSGDYGSDEIGTVQEVFVRLENPFTFDLTEDGMPGTLAALNGLGLRIEVSGAENRYTFNLVGDQPKRFTRAAKAAGFDGVVVYRDSWQDATGRELSEVVAFAPEQIKSVENTGAFDRNDPNIFNQGKRGSIILPPRGGQSQMNLFEKADLSTVLHEGAHYFLWVLQNMAEDGDATAAAEMSTLTEWWGRNTAAIATEAGVTENIVRLYLAKGTTGNAAADRQIGVALHEQFARGFEAYTMEGKSPSNALRAAFESFAAWMMAIYKDKRALNVTLDDEVRGVFDRLLATDEELENSRVENNMGDEIAEVAREMGLDPESYQRLMELTGEARDEAKQLALKDVMEPIFRERRAEIKRERAEITARVTDEVMNKKHNRVIQFIANGVWVGGDIPEDLRGVDMRMDTDMLRDEYDIDVRTLPRGKRPLHARDTLVQADEVAELFGYASGSAMLNDLTTAPKASVEIKGRVDGEINAKYGDSLTDGSIEQQAVDALHGDKRGQVIVAELRAINRIASRKQKVTSRQQASAIAREMIAKMPARDAVRTGTFIGAERRYAERATRALAAGDTEAAFAAKRKQLINYALYVEGRKAAEMVGKVERLSGKLRKRSTRKALAGEYLEAIDDILDTYDFRKTSAKADQRRAGLAAYVDMMKKAGRDNELAIPSHVLSQAQRVPYKTLPTQRLQGVYDALQNIEHTARMKQKLRDRKAARDMDDVVSSISAAFAANVKGKPSPRFPTGVSKAIDATKEYVNLTLNADTILRRIDGWVLGDTLANIKRGIDEAETFAMDLRTKAAKDFERLYSVYGRVERSRMAVRKTYGGYPEAMSKWDLISIALNTGNKDNFERLTSLDASARFTPEQVEALVAKLDERDWKFVQSVWDYIDSYWGMIAERERRTTGVAPEKVVPMIQVENVAAAGVRGGYYPIKYDANRSSKVSAEQEQDLFSNMQAGAFGKAQTRNGHTKERAAGGGGRTLQLGMHILHGHVQSVIHDLAFSEPVNASWKILQDPRVRALFEENGMVADHRSLEVWLQDVATGQISTAGILGNVARRAKAGFTISKLAFNMSTVAVQLTGMTQSMALIGSRDMAIGVSKYVAGGMIPVAARIKARSSFMAERETTFQRDIYDLLGETSTGPLMSPVRQTRDMLMKAGFYLMQKVQFYTVDAPTWIAAYEKSLRSGSSDKDAAYEADRMVARAQASGLFADRSAIERGSLTPSQRQNDFVRLFTALGSYMFAKLNVATEVVGRTDFGSPASILKMLMDLALLFTIEAVAYNFIKGTLPGVGDAEDDQSWAAFLAAETALSALGTLPFIRDFGGAIRGFGGGGAYGGVIETVSDGGASVVALGRDIMGGEEMTASEVRSMIDGVGLAVPGVPSTAINRILRVEEARGEGDEVSPIAYIMGLPR